MEIKIGEKYFFKLRDGSVITGFVKDKNDDMGFIMVDVIDKYKNLVSFRADEIIKFELFKEQNPEKKLTTSFNTVNKQV